jgi:hypothetical protein
MRCFTCRKGITGADLKRRVEEHDVDGRVLVFGDGMPDGNLSEATGPLVRVRHHKCYYASVKHAQIQAARAAEGASLPFSADWRDQETLAVEELTGEGHRNH